MITKIYQHRRYINRYQLVFSSLVFLTLTFFFFFTFLNICFQNIVTDPPILLMIILFIILAIDLAAYAVVIRKLLSIRLIINIAILVFLFLSWILNNQIIFYFSAGVFIRFPEIIQYNYIVRDQLKGKKPALFKIYIVIKIFYMMAVVGHVLGCIFYVIDQHLIRQQYYGPVSQNPTMYYQGAVACFTPIQALSEIQRYAYAMYYIVSLQSTVAYGDIIPHNPFQNAYVVVLLVCSTIGISFIIEQMIIVFRNDQLFLYDLLRKIKFFDFMLWQANFSNQNRRQLIRFTISSYYRQISYQAKIKNMSSQMKSALFMATLDPQSKFMKTFLPPMLIRVLINRLRVSSYPPTYTLLDNQQTNEICSSNFSLKIMIEGKIKIGYGNAMQCPTIASEKGFLVGWLQFLWQTTIVQQYMKIQTIEPSAFYELELTKFVEFKAGRTNKNGLTQQEKFFNQNYQEFVQKMEMQRNYQLFNQEALKCWFCDTMGHLPNKCYQLHYRPNYFTITDLQPRQKDFKRRSNIRSKKIIGIQPQTAHFYQRRTLNEFILRKRTILNGLKEKLNESEDKSEQKCQIYRDFFPNYNIKNRYGN